MSRKGSDKLSDKSGTIPSSRGCRSPQNGWWIIPNCQFDQEKHIPTYGTSGTNVQAAMFSPKSATRPICVTVIPPLLESFMFLFFQCQVMDIPPWNQGAIYDLSSHWLNGELGEPSMNQPTNSHSIILLLVDVHDIPHSLADSDFILIIFPNIIGIPKNIP